MKAQFDYKTGKSPARTKDKKIKIFNGEEVRAHQKLDIRGRRKEIVADIHELLQVITSNVGFWKSHNPFLKSGYMFNGSSQHLMNPELEYTIESVKYLYGDIDVIVPIEKLSELTVFLDRFDDDEEYWKPTIRNGLTDKFNYMGRGMSPQSFNDQVVTFWRYRPTDQVVQIDFEGDEMNLVNINGEMFRQPSEWIKFMKDSPWEDLVEGVKGLAGIIMIRALTRTVNCLGDVDILTKTGVKQYNEGKPFTAKAISSDKKHTMPSRYTFNTGGGTPGIRRAYKFIGSRNNRALYVFIEPKEAKGLGPEFETITDIEDIFKNIFNVYPTKEDISNFRSLKGILKSMNKFLSDEQVNLGLQRFNEILDGENLTDTERQAIYTMIRKTII